MTALAAASGPAGLLAGFVDHDDRLGGQRAYRLQRRAAARAFLARHPDLDEWMARPVEARLVELHRHDLVWPFVAYAIVTGAVRADVELLFAKNFGHSVFRWINVLFPGDIARLEDAAVRLGAASPRVAVRGAVQFGRCVRWPGADDVDGRGSRPARRGDRRVSPVE